MTSCRSCASCERELSAVRLELQAVARERDQYRDALTYCVLDCCARIGDDGPVLDDHGVPCLVAGACESCENARVALSRERKDDPVKPALTRWERKQLDAMDAGERKDTNA